MYARVVSARAQLDKLDEAIDICRSMEPSWQQQTGFRGATVLCDRESGQIISISNWETRDDLEATETSGWYQEQVDKFAATWVTPPERTIFEVPLQIGMARAMGGA